MPLKFPSKSETSIPAGFYDKRIIIQKFTGVPDGMGTTTEPWVDYLTVWAHVSSKLGYKQVQAGQVYPTKRTIFYIRYRPSDVIDTAMRAKYKNHIYTIIYIDDPQEAQTNIEIHTEEQKTVGSP